MSLSKSPKDTLTAAEVNTFPQKAVAETITGGWTFDTAAFPLNVAGRETHNVPSGVSSTASQFILTDSRATHGGDYVATWSLTSDSDHNQGFIFSRTAQTAFYLGNLRSADDFRVVADPLGTPKINVQFMPDGGIVMPNLPTADPLVAGELWNDAGTLKVSAG